jgi:predicted Zn-dependent protease
MKTSEAIEARHLPSAQPAARCLKRWAGAALVASFAFASVAAPARAQSISLVRDAETEALIADYTRPIFKAAGLSGQNIKVHLVNNQTFNAFVLDSHNMFIHTGAILQSQTPNQLIGVIAHETGHIVGGHLASLRQQLTKMQTAALMLQILGMGAMIGGAVAGGDNSAGQAGAAVLYGGQSVLARSLLSYRRAQESTADRSAVEFLNRTHQSPRGMLETFQHIADQSLSSVTAIDPYLQSHPMPHDRIAQLREIAKASPYYDAKDPPELQLRHDLVRAKIEAYVYKNNPQRILRDYPATDHGLPARYARAIVKFHSGGGANAALPDIDALIAEKPDYPYFHEIKGRFLVESGRAKEAIAPLRKAVALASNESAFIRIQLAQALLETDSQANIQEALQDLRLALVKEDQSYLGYRLQADALGKLKRFPEADLASAQASFHHGDLKNAKMLAERAKKGLNPGTPQWIKADDIANFKLDKKQG